MANLNLTPQVPTSIEVPRGTITSLQTLTTAVPITSILPRPLPPSGGPVAHGPFFSLASGNPHPNTVSITQSIIVETETTILVQTLTFTIGENESTPTLTSGLHHTTSLSSAIETSPGKLAPSGSTAPPKTPSLVSSTVTLLSTSFVDLSTGHPLLPSVTSTHEGGESNETLVRVLPSVLLPLSFIIILACFVFLKRRRLRSLTSTSAIFPFNPVNSPHSTNLHGSVFVSKKQERIITDAGAETLTTRGGFSNPSSPRDGSRGGFNLSRMEGDALATVNEELGPPVVHSDNLQVPASRSEILELQNRLADIEARHISLPPPEYSSERGR